MTGNGAHPDAFAGPLAQVNAELLERLPYFALRPQVILDLGAGSCRASLALRARYPQAQVLAIDLALAPLQDAPRRWWPRARFHRAAGDAMQLPLADHSVDLVYSNLLLPSCARPDRVIAEVARVLKEGGLFVFSTLGPDTLMELRAASASANHPLCLNDLPTLPQLGDALMHTGLVEPVMDTEHHQLHYAEATALLRDLRHSAERAACVGRRTGLTTKRSERRLLAAYDQVRSAAGLPVTFELVFGAAFAGGRSGDPGGPSGGEMIIPVGSIKRHVR